MTRTLSVWVGASIIYLYGTVNGEAATFTLIGAGEWQATVPRAEDDNYVLHLEAYSANGLEGAYDYTLYYGMMPCVADRTWDDVRNKTAKGFYNATDLNRVGHNVSYLAELLGGYGYAVNVSPKVNWQIDDIPRVADMGAHLADVDAIKSAFYGTVPLPDTMDDLTVEGANNIERLLCEIEQNIHNMTEAWYYCGELYCGEV
jgi:hypothetical protein